MTARRLFALGPVCAALTACGQQASPPAQPPPVAAPAPPPAAAKPPLLDLSRLPPVEPPAPGTPGGLADDRTPLSEAPFTPTSAQGAADVVQAYFALIGEKKYAQAWALWADEGRASGMTVEAFVKSFDRYYSYGAQVGGPGRIEGAAGSLHIEVPVVVYGRLRTGEPVHMNGPFRLRRSNDVPGSTENQLKWRIESSGLQPSP